MIYLQAAGCILVASSPEILCRLDSSRVVTNRCAHTCHLVQTLPTTSQPEHVLVSLCLGG